MTTDLRPRLPIGISDFRELREPGVIYVDKTDLITQVLESRARVLLLPRPRRFGKTGSLSTIRYFVEKSKEGRTALFAGLAVSTSAAARPHFQRYLVILLTFKDVKAGSFDLVFEAIRSVIRRAHEEHAYLLDEGAPAARASRQVPADPERGRPRESLRRGAPRAVRARGPLVPLAKSLVRLLRRCAAANARAKLVCFLGHSPQTPAARARR